MVLLASVGCQDNGEARAAVALSMAAATVAPPTSVGAVELQWELGCNAEACASAMEVRGMGWGGRRGGRGEERGEEGRGQ